MIVLDASVWVSILLRRDTNNPVSRQWAARWAAGGGQFVVPNRFLAEVAGAVSRQLGRAIAGRRTTRVILASPRFQISTVDRSLAEAAARHAANLPLKGADAVYVALAEQLGVPLVTWDQEQLTRAAGVIAVQSPTI